MKEFIIAIFSPLLQLNVVISTIGGFLLGGFMGGMTSSLFGGSSFNVTTGLIFAAIAFANSAIISGAGLAVDRIRELMEEQVNLARQEYTAQRALHTSSSVVATTPSAAASQASAAFPASGGHSERVYDVTKIIVCPQCGARNRNDRAFCYRCELPLEGVDEQSTT